MSALTGIAAFTAVQPVGGLIPMDMLVRIATGKDAEGCTPADYRVVGVRSVADDAERHWDFLKKVWRELRKTLPVAPEADLPADPTGKAVREWLEPLFNEFGFGSLTHVGPDGISSDDGEKTFAISHRWNHVPIHLTAWNGDFDKRSGGSGTVPPQSLVQECLNRTEAHLWAVLSNGRRLRLLRDSSAMATAAYVEFDLEAIFDGELFSEFVLLYRMLHVTRFEVAETEPASACWLEKWRAAAIKSGMRALDQLRNGVKDAITALGTGFLQHPDNHALRQNLEVEALHTALLRVVYRMIFLFVAEDRNVLHRQDVPDEVRRRYAKYFSSDRLRKLSNRRQGSPHGDLYQALLIVLNGLGDEGGRPELGVPGLGGLFDGTKADTPLRGLSLSNEWLLRAVGSLARVRDADSSRWRPVDYEHMGSEELGSVYESLLELIPNHSAVDRTFELVERAGNDRKKTGSYYTPSSLIETLLDSSLDPVIDDAVKRGEVKASKAGQPDAREAIVAELLSLTVCDPACGSGHFLVAAARRIAKRVAAVREGNPEPTRGAVQHAMHEVIANCVYGVDLNPMAVELAKVSLWLEAMEPGQPLSFLDAHIKVGNGLIGATPKLLREGIPNKAFKLVEGDDKKIAKSFEIQNNKERTGQKELFSREVGFAPVSNAVFVERLRSIAAAPVGTLRDIHRQAAAFREWESAPAYVRAKHVADAWCAAFTCYKTEGAPTPVTHSAFEAVRDSQDQEFAPDTRIEIERLRDQYRFFHWHLEFPEIFSVPDGENGEAGSATGWSGGFSCVLANPPWDKVDFEDQKYFSVSNPSIAALVGARRRARIAEWLEEDPEGAQKYRQARRMVKSTFKFGSASGAFPLCAQGLTVRGVNSLQVDQLFAERFMSIVSQYGRVGCIVPTAVATGAGAQFLFGDMVRRGMLSMLFDFENRKPLFLDVHRSYKFCLLALDGSVRQSGRARFAFFLSDVTESEGPGRVFELSQQEIELINPNTGNLPIFRSRRDADLTVSMYRRMPVLFREGKTSGDPWKVKFKNLFNSTDDSDIFLICEQFGNAKNRSVMENAVELDGVAYSPVYEGKMAHLYDHRWNRYYGQGDNDYEAVPESVKGVADSVIWPRRYVKRSGIVRSRRGGEVVEIQGLLGRLQAEGWLHNWLCGWRDIARVTDERTAIPAFISLSAAVETFPVMLSYVEPILVATLIAAQSSIVFDYSARQKASGAHMGRRIWKQLPVPTPEMMGPHLGFVVPRVLELVYTAYDMTPLARDLEDSGAPFRWDEERRAQLRAELDAFFFHLYGIERDDVEYILETFQSDSGGGLKNNEIAKFGTYRTRDLVLAEYDRMAPTGVDLDVPLVDGQNYTSPLTPPPGRGPRHKPAPENSEEE